MNEDNRTDVWPLIVRLAIFGGIAFIAWQVARKRSIPAAVASIAPAAAPLVSTWNPLP